MDPSLHAYVWSTLGAGVAANPHKCRTTQQIAEETDKLVAEYFKRHEQLFPDPRRHSSGLGDGQ